MLFASHVFLFWFLPAFLAMYVLAGPRGRMLVLTLFSYLFYGWWDWRFCLLILLSTVIDYVCGLLLHRSTHETVRRRWLLVSMSSNLGLLGFFKYFMFLRGAVAGGASRVGFDLPAEVLALEVVLPVGISFYTFQSMSYTIDIYRREAKPTRNFLDFMGYISMFPQLVAGPIVRYSEMETQIAAPAWSPERIYLGCQFFVLGLAKKVLVADTLAPLANSVFDAPVLTGLATGDAWLATIAYTLQIYFDFSGYSDMAVGLGLWCGFVFPINFNSPYKSASIAEFWRRWHITLSTWLRDYLYIPLGGNRNGPWNTYRNLLITMLLGGLWHGANWTFVVWGAYHGLLLALERWFGGERALARVPQAVRRAAVLLLVMVGWVFFRAKDLDTAFAVLGSMFTWQGVGSSTHASEPALSLIVLWPALFITFVLKNSWEWTANVSLAKTALLTALFLASLVGLLGAVDHPFLYFQF